MNVSVREIAAFVSMRSGVDIRRIMNTGSRERESADARAIVIHLAYHFAGKSHSQIGRSFGTDHTLSAHSVKRSEERRTLDPKYKALVAEMTEALEHACREFPAGGLDVLAVARRIAGNPRRMALAASVIEIEALAATVIDLWDITQLAEMLAEEIARPADAIGADTVRTVVGLVKAIRIAIAETRGEQPAEARHD